MLIVMKPEATDGQIEEVLQLIRDLGYKPHPMPGATRTAIGITGNQAAIELQEARLLTEQKRIAKDLDARVRAKEENVGSIRSDYLPTVYVSGGYEYMENQYQVHPENWTVIAGVNINLFAGGSTTSRVSVAKSELLSLRLGRPIRWDPEKEEVIGDREAAAQLVRPYRKPWDDVLRSFKL